jgi:nucleoside-diphosphate-sugar epimerase
MKVFVAGASGVIGRRLVPMLVGAGHEVTGITRSSERTETLRAMGATPVVGDVFDPEALTGALVEAGPEVVVHELTDIPATFDGRRMETEMAGNDRIRTEGTRNLVAAAVAAGARRLVAQSIAFAYAPTGQGLKTEDDSLFDDAPWPYSRGIQAVHDLEDAVTGTPGLEGIVLRYGFFYGPGSTYAKDGGLAGRVARRRFPIVGRGAGVFSFIHVDDAAAATVAAVERGRPGIYNVVDDDPAPLREWLPVYAVAIGAKKPLRVPKFVARLVGGVYATLVATELRGASNERAKAELSWQPRYPSWRQGFKDSLG